MTKERIRISLAMTLGALTIGGAAFLTFYGGASDFLHFDSPTEGEGSEKSPSEAKSDDGLVALKFSLKEAQEQVSDSEYPNETADAIVSNLEAGELREAFVRWCAEQEWATHESQIFETIQVFDHNPVIQELGIVTRLKLAPDQQTRTEILRTLLERKSGALPILAMKQLSEYPIEALGAPLKKLITVSGSYSGEAITALGYVGSESDLQYLADIIADSRFEESLRIRAIVALSEIGGEAAQKELKHWSEGEFGLLSKAAASELAQ